MLPDRQRKPAAIEPSVDDSTEHDGHPRNSENSPIQRGEEMGSDAES
jgi:hypothetical protein